MHEAGAIDDLKQILRDRGLHATGARIAVLQILREEHLHATAETIREQVLDRYPALDPATVYRTLESLEAHGLAVRVELRERATRWAHVTANHHHMVCKRCGALVELDDAPFRRLASDLRSVHGIQPDLQHMVLHGVCAACLESETR